MKRSVRDLVLSSLFLVLGVLVPQAFHLFGAGNVFLPMHLSVLLCGFFLPWPYALAVGALTPVLSSILTGMPPLLPMLPIMIPELAAYATVASLLAYHKCFALFNNRFNLYTTLVSSMVVGRVFAGIASWVVTLCFASVKLPPPITYVLGGIVSGLPGIAIQILLLPPIVFALRKVITAGNASDRSLS